MSKIMIKLEDRFSSKSSVHMIRNPENYSQLIKTVRETFKNKLPDSFSLSYKDKDDEIINLSNEEGFAATIAFLQEENIKSLKIFITKKEKEEDLEDLEEKSSEKSLKNSKIVEIKNQIPPFQNEVPEKSEVEGNLQKVTSNQEASNTKSSFEKDATTIPLIKNEVETQTNHNLEILAEKSKEPVDFYEEIPITPIIKEKNQLLVDLEEKKEDLEIPSQSLIFKTNEEKELNSESNVMFRTRIFEEINEKVNDEINNYDHPEKKEEVNPFYTIPNEEINRQNHPEGKDKPKNIELNADLRKIFQDFISKMIEAPISFPSPCRKCQKKKSGWFQDNAFCNFCKNTGHVIITNDHRKIKLLENFLNAKLSFALAQISGNDPQPIEPILKDAIKESEFKACICQAPPNLTLTSSQIKSNPKLLFTIEIENIGLNSWPSQVFLICVEGYLKNTLKEVISLAPAEKKAGKFEIKSPSGSKVNRLVWKLGWFEEGMIKYFGPNIVHMILVEDEWEQEKEDKTRTEEEKRKKEEERKKNENVKKKAKELAEFCGYKVDVIEKFIRKNRLDEMKIETIAEEILVNGIEK